MSASVIDLLHSFTRFYTIGGYVTTGAFAVLLWEILITLDVEVRYSPGLCAALTRVSAARVCLECAVDGPEVHVALCASARRPPPAAPGVALTVLLIAGNQNRTFIPVFLALTFFGPPFRHRSCSDADRSVTSL